LGGDDKFDETYIFECLKIFSNNEDCSTVFCHFHLFDVNANQIFSKITPSSSSSDFPFIRMKNQLRDPVPNVLFGLHKTSILKKIDVFEAFDWFDVLGCIQLSYYGKIYIIPRYLYYCGIDGPRKPYSLTGKYLSLNTFKRRLRVFSRYKLSFWSRLQMFILSEYSTFYAQKSINKVIRNWKHY